jgi:hypothetical protein
MAKTAVTDLTNEQLDYFVAEAENILYMRDADGCVLEIGGDGRVYGKTSEERMFPYAPTVDWRAGGKIIERKKIRLQHVGESWTASIESGAPSTGPTPLVAAMRAVVVAKFGAMVNPD